MLKHVAGTGETSMPDEIGHIKTVLIAQYVLCLRPIESYAPWLKANDLIAL